MMEANNATLSFPRDFLTTWAGGGISFDESIESGDVSLTGKRSIVAEFFKKFELAEGSDPFGLGGSIDAKYLFSVITVVTF